MMARRLRSKRAVDGRADKATSGLPGRPSRARLPVPTSPAGQAAPGRGWRRGPLDQPRTRD